MTVLRMADAAKDGPAKAGPAKDGPSKGVSPLDVGLPPQLASHKSGGRDLWSAPLDAEPDDPVAAAWTALGEVLDPELPISLVDLGLVYGLDVVDGVATVRITYTATGCPCMEFIQEDISDRLGQEEWIRSVRIEDVWDPPWTTARISDHGRKTLRTLGVGA